MNASPRRALALAALVGGGLLAVSARADVTKDQCIEANAKGQDLAHDGKLSAARVQFQVCVVAACPALLRVDCTKRLDELDRIQPSVVFTAQDATGGDVGGVTVTVDGAPLAVRLDGTPMRVDPGEHTFVFSAPGHAPVSKKLVLAERDASRRERVLFAGGGAAPPAPAPAPAPATDTTTTSPSSPSSSPSGGMSTLRLAGIVTGGVGVVGLGVGGVFGLLTGSAWNAQKSDCPSSQNCPSYGQALKDHSAMATDSTVATVSFIAGGALLAAGITMFVLGGSGEEAPASTAAVVVAPSVSPSGGGVSVAGAF